MRKKEMMEIRSNAESGSRYSGHSWPEQIRLLIIALVLVLSLIFSALYVYTLVIWPQESKRAGSTWHIGNDFILPYSAALLALDGTPEKAFDYGVLHKTERRGSKDPALGLIPWAYPPFYQLMLMPLGGLDYITAYRVFVLLTLALLAIIAWHIAPHRYTPLLLLIFPAVVFCAAKGQNGNLSAALIGAGLLLLKRRPIASGIAFGLMAYKPHLAVVIPFCLLAGRHYRALISTALTALATVLISVVALGGKPLIAFLLHIAPQAGVVFDHPLADLWQRMPTVMVLMLQMTGNQMYAWIAQNIVAVISLAAVVWIWRQSHSREWKSLALVASIPLATPYFFDYDMVIFVLPLFFLLWEQSTSGFTYSRALIMATLWLVPPVVFLRPIWFPNLWQIGPIVWASLLGYVVYKVARDRSHQFQNI
jgi:hypothetical protein